MNIAKTKIPADVLPILSGSTFEGNVLTLPAQLDRETYLRVDKILKAARGKWDRKAKGHVFPFDPRELIGTAVLEGAVVDHKKTLQFFETPDCLAGRMVDLAQIGPGDRVLEPSAGRGRIVRHLSAAGAITTAVEIDADNCKALRDIEGNLKIVLTSFEIFQDDSTSRYDAVVMNPPFANNQDIRHIRAAWDMLAPGGRLVAICSEGPFFRNDAAAVVFREWLDEIDATTEQLPTETFRESGTTVATRLIVAKMEGSRTQAATPVESLVRNIPTSQITADPGQPRKVFERTALSELAASIRADGLLQPITVRPVGPDAYMIIAGERRFRACQINNLPTVRAIVIETDDVGDIRVKQIIENDQRQDVTPLEQARSYQALMDEQGWTVEELGQRIGKSPHRILERTVLLTLRPEYQELLASGNLKPSEATELARLSPRGQTVLFAAIRAGSCKTYNDLRAQANALVNAEAQLDLMSDMPDQAAAPTREDRDLATGFEAQVERIASMLRSGISDNQIVAVRKTNPHRASHLADLLAAMQKDIRRIEVGLREAAVQASFFGG